MTLHKATGQARVRLSGVDFYLGPWGSEEAKRRYDDKVAAWLGSGRSLAPVRTAGEALTCDHLADLFLKQHAEPYYRKSGVPTNTYAKFRTACERAFEAGLFEGDADGFTPRHLMALQKYLAELRGGPYARQTINEMVRQLVEIFRWGTMIGYCRCDCMALELVKPLRKGRPAPGSTVVPREYQTRQPAPLRSIAAALRQAHPVLEAMIRVQWLTGMRPGALVMMRRGDLLTTRRNRGVMIYTPRADAYKLEHVDQIPTHLRNIYVGPRASAILRPLLSGLGRNDFVFSPRRAVDIFNAGKRSSRKVKAWASHAPEARKSRRGTADRADRDHYSTDSYRRAIERACARAGLARADFWSPNQLRHAAATRLRELADVDAAQVLLGHASVTTTEIYAKPTISKAIDTAARFG